MNDIRQIIKKGVWQRVLWVTSISCNNFSSSSQGTWTETVYF